MNFSVCDSSLSTSNPATPVSASLDSTLSIIELAKQDVERSQQVLISRQMSVTNRYDQLLKVAAVAMQ